jgi:putative selenium metabolism hydrolase
VTRNLDFKTLGELIDFVRSLVRAPSVLGQERQVADLVIRQMHQLGFSHTEIDSAGNAVGVIQGSSPGPKVLLDAHMDTVDVLPREAWSYDPFGARVDNGRIYGRGTSDMKGALGAALFGAAALSETEFSGEVILSASVGEESTEGSALELVMRRYSPDFVIICESTQLRVATAGRGRSEFLIFARGKAAHASTPHLGVNAVFVMTKVIEKIENLQMPEHPFVGKGLMCLTDIISDPYPAHSVVPSGCKVTYERRLLPGEELESVLDQLVGCCTVGGIPAAEVALAQAQYETYTGAFFDQPKWYPAWEVSSSSELVEKSLKGLQQAGLDPKVTSYQFCTNAAYSAGVKKVPTIGFGPSREELAHTADEYVAIEQLEQAYFGYSSILGALLGQ